MVGVANCPCMVMRGCTCSLLRRLERDQNKCLLYGIAGCPLLRGFEYTKLKSIWKNCPLTTVSDLINAPL